jgi:hypothetical protein
MDIAQARLTRDRNKMAVRMRRKFRLIVGIVKTLSRRILLKCCRSIPEFESVNLKVG